jgi:hypothetical protein
MTKEKFQAIEKFRRYVLLKHDPTEAFEECLKLFKKIDPEDFVKPNTGPNVAMQNARVRVALYRCAKARPGCLVDTIKNPRTTTGAPTASPFKPEHRIEVRAPAPTWTADYSGGPRQGSYLGYKPPLNVTKNVGLRVTHIIQ